MLLRLMVAEAKNGEGDGAHNMFKLKRPYIEELEGDFANILAWCLIGFLGIVVAGWVLGVLGYLIG
jgi:hypothetical protein